MNRISNTRPSINCGEAKRIKYRLVTVIFNPLVIRQGYIYVNVLGGFSMATSAYTKGANTCFPIFSMAKIDFWPKGA